ncbi:acyl carrier protein [Verrucomicrobia bacterium]|jgi:acyl carrier protein|nr:acyl carrier protein [Verrucomicrobiota bacterium]
MTRETILVKLQEIFIDIFDDEDINLTFETTADDIEDWDSLSHINLVVAIEKDYKMKFALGELQDLKNVGDMCSLVLSKLGM